MAHTPSMFQRSDHEPPPVVTLLGWRFHHVGVPASEPREGEVYLPAFKLYVAGFSTSPFGVEWMRYEEGSPIPELIRTVPHVAFEVVDLDEAIIGWEVLYPPCNPSQGVRSAMILHNGAPVELIEFRK